MRSLEYSNMKILMNSTNKQELDNRNLYKGSSEQNNESISLFFTNKSMSAHKQFIPQNPTRQTSKEQQVSKTHLNSTWCGCTANDVNRAAKASTSPPMTAVSLVLPRRQVPRTKGAEACDTAALSEPIHAANKRTQTRIYADIGVYIHELRVWTHIAI